MPGRAERIGGPHTRRWLQWAGLGLALAGLLSLAACASPALSATGLPPALRTNTPSRPLAVGTTSTPAQTQAADAVTQPAGLPTSGATITPHLTLAPTRTSAPPCADQACVLQASHLWLARPIPSGQGFVDYVDRSYPYASTQGGQREPHHGVEFFNPAGTLIVAAGAGRVVVAGPDDVVAYGPATRFYGNLVVIELDQRYADQPVYTLYGHMRQVTVAAGDRVQAGDPIGIVGSTGVAIGAHLHFEVRIGEDDYASSRNPELWLIPLPLDGQPQGVVAGRVVDREGHWLQHVTVVVRPLATRAEHPRTRYIQTYAADPLINADDRLQENFAIGDVPPGLYSISVSTTKFYEQTITVEAGKVAWATFVVNPPAPGSAVSETPATPTPEAATPGPVTSETATPETATPTLGAEEITATQVPAEVTPTDTETPAAEVTPTAPTPADVTPTPEAGSTDTPTP